MDSNRRPSALQAMLNMFRLSNAPTVQVSDDRVNSDVDEPSDHVPELDSSFQKQSTYSKAAAPPPLVRRESLLTRAIAAGNNPVPPAPTTNMIPPRLHGIPRALSTSSHSVPSTAELTSDGELTSPTRSLSPSPPPPSMQIALPLSQKHAVNPDSKVVISPVTQDDKPTVVDVGEAAVEKKLGRKRCIMFACADRKPDASSKESQPTSLAADEHLPAPEPRKCRLTFACPTRQDSSSSHLSTESKTSNERRLARPHSPAPMVRRISASTSTVDSANELPIQQPIPVRRTTPLPTFHEFAGSQNETDAWIDQPTGIHQSKLTLNDVMRKENAIRQITEEAEEEAEEEEREQEELDAELDEENDVEDDFAPSDDERSDAGNESDDEGGFADSDDDGESDVGSECQFWGPAVITTATNTENLTHFSARQRSRSSSLDSSPSQSSVQPCKAFHPRKNLKTKAIKMRPGTPELPDSTDFVCGTLDEDRPLEAAYIACREQKKREKHIPIPQDIDPSFPTTDPEQDEDEDENEEDAAEESEPVWVRNQFGQLEDDDRGRHPPTIKLSPSQAAPRPQRPQMVPLRRGTNRSPPPPRNRSPAPQRLFSRSPSQMKSSPPQAPCGSSRGSPGLLKMPLGITINRLTQRPDLYRTASLPQTPNPFFHNWKKGSPVTSRIPSAAVSPGSDEALYPDLHVRGPVDIVIGLEKKRQKRKEKYWRQHCRKAAKEQAERKPIPGRGVERMKELGLEVAERTRGYGLGQQAKLVLSL